MPQRRQDLVALAFDKVNKLRLDAISPEELIACFDGVNHPQVQFGNKSSADVRNDFLATFDVPSDTNMVSYTDFENYYTSVSACIESDVEFEHALCSSWDVPMSVRASAALNKKLLNSSTKKNDYEVYKQIQVDSRLVLP